MTWHAAMPSCQAHALAARCTQILLPAPGSEVETSRVFSVLLVEGQCAERDSEVQSRATLKPRSLRDSLGFYIKHTDPGTPVLHKDIPAGCWKGESGPVSLRFSPASPRCMWPLGNPASKVRVRAQGISSTPHTPKFLLTSSAQLRSIQVACFVRPGTPPPGNCRQTVFSQRKQYLVDPMFPNPGGRVHCQDR